MLLPFDWLLSVIIAALIHEAGHILTVILLGGKVHRIRISVTGCVIDSGGLRDAERLMSILAGPVSSLGLVCLRIICPKIAVCGLFQGLFNLLPILPLDGGRILQLLLFRFCPRQESAVMNILKYGVWLLAGGILLWVLMKS